MRTKKKTMLAGCAAVGLILPAMAERIKYDFETGDLQGWKIVQGHFAKPVTDRAKEHHGDRPYVKEGKWFLSTLERPDGRPDDSQTGVIESPSFRLLSPRVTFRVGGGKGASFQLVDRATDRPIASVAGANAQALRPGSWNLPEAVGRTVFFRVEDLTFGGWCHITVDDILCDGEPLPDDFAARATRTVGAGVIEAKNVTLSNTVCEVGG